LNPQLGWRSIRISLDEPVLFRRQLRAILRASARGPVRVLLPMVIALEEVREARKIFETCKQELRREKLEFDPKTRFGVMIETPASVVMADSLAREADFFSVGTNDLIQFTLAVDRNNPKVAAQFEPLNPAVLASLDHVGRVAAKHRTEVSICGEMAGDEFITPLLLGMGYTKLSMASKSLERVTYVLRRCRTSECRRLAANVLRARTVAEVRTLLLSYHKKIGTPIEE
jgi:phosphotransferase system enzyme I (PtsI)